jgi:hypothetical protein
MTKPKSGHCLCGRCRFEYDGVENWSALCHCESCRRQTASPFTAFVGVPNGTWRWLGDNPKFYQSSSGVKRYFCATCGAPMAFQGDKWPDEIHFYAALLDDPLDFVPQDHVHYDERLLWLKIDDDLPKHRKSSPPV